MHFDPKFPICDGIPYSDLMMLKTERDQNILAARGVVFATEFCTPDGFTICGDIIASSWEAAEQIAFGRSLGEKVTMQITGIGFWEPPSLLLKAARRPGHKRPR